MDLLDDLLSTLEGQTDDDAASNALVDCDASCETSEVDCLCVVVPKPPSSPPTADSNDANTTISLLEDCLKSLWKGRDADAAQISPSYGMDSSSRSPALAEQHTCHNDDAVTIDKTTDYTVIDQSSKAAPSKKTHKAHLLKNDNSLLSRAVQNRIQREKDEARKQIQEIESKRTTTQLANDEAINPNPAIEDLVGQMNHDANAIATQCFEAFLQEMNDFKLRSSQIKTSQDIIGYADYLTEKYIILSLDKLPVTPTSTKSRLVICGFIDKLKQKAGGEGKKSWACSICSKQNGPSDAICKTCGRKKGYAPKAKKQSKPCHVPLISKAAREKKSNKTGYDRRKDMFLKQKNDYESDARQDIADEISDLLGTVVRTTIS